MTNQILLISTITDVIITSIALLKMNFFNVFGNELLFSSEYLAFYM